MRRFARVMFGLLLAMAALGALAFIFETLLAVLEQDAPMSSLVPAAVAIVLFLWCARTSWRLLVRRGRPEDA